jgi:hypothetical protein
MLEMVRQLSADAAKVAASALWSITDADLAERADEEALRRQEARAHAKRSLSLSLPIDGVVRVSGTLGVAPRPAGPLEGRAPSEHLRRCLSEPGRLVLSRGHP